jgi:hypothetical protein
MREWLSEGYDPEAFPIAEVNQQLAKSVDALVDEYLDIEEA